MGAARIHRQRRRGARRRDRLLAARARRAGRQLAPPADQVGHAWWSLIGGKWSTECGIDRVVGELSTFHFDEIHTDSPLRGHARINLWQDGSYTFRGHMHGSGFDPYEFIIQAAVKVNVGTDAYMAMEAFRAGSVDGWEPFGDEERSYDWYEMGTDTRVLAYFGQVHKDPVRKLHIQEQHENVGVGGTIESLVSNVLDDFLNVLVDNIASRTLVVALALGRELEDLIGIEDLGANGWLGFAILSVGGVFWLQIPQAAILIPMLPGGPNTPVVGGKARPMEPAEWAWAGRVFGGTLPPPGRIWITNLRSPKDSAFTNVDGDRFLVHMGEAAYERPQEHVGESGNPGETFIHELTHVWDAFYSGPFWETEAMVAQFDIPEVLPDAGRSWNKLSIEEKAVVVAHWYGEHHTELDSPNAHSHRYFHYIRDHIRAKVN